MVTSHGFAATRGREVHEKNEFVSDFHVIFRHGRACPGHPRGWSFRAAENIVSVDAIEIRNGRVVARSSPASLTIAALAKPSPISQVASANSGRKPLGSATGTGSGNTPRTSASNAARAAPAAPAPEVRSGYMGRGVEWNWPTCIGPSSPSPFSRVGSPVRKMVGSIIYKFSALNKPRGWQVAGFLELQKKAPKGLK